MLNSDFFWNFLKFTLDTSFVVRYTFLQFAEIAQLVEHCTENARVASSSLALSTQPH